MNRRTLLKTAVGLGTAVANIGSLDMFGPIPIKLSREFVTGPPDTAFKPWKWMKMI